MFIRILFYLFVPYCLEAFTLEEKIGQLLLVHFHGSEYNETAKKLINEAYVGGFIYYDWANDLNDPKKIRKLSDDLQFHNKKINSLPLFIAIDHEGGRVVRIPSLTQFQSPLERAFTQFPIIEKKVATAMANELHSVGINMNLAPVADCGPNQSFMGNRMYSDNPQEVLKWCEMALEGYLQANMLPVIKHFPGHGFVTNDSHIGKTILKNGDESLRIFYDLTKMAPAFMTAHVTLLSFDDKPATFSKTLLTNLLRDKWNYEGLIISDSLVMKAALDNKTIEETAFEALLAGCDILCLGGKLLNEKEENEISEEEILKVHRYLVNAVKTNQISEKRIDQSVERIKAAKEKYLIFNDLNCFENHHILKKEIDLFIELKKNLNSDFLTRIGKGIYLNETGGKKEKLLFWNMNEEFPSLGMGHFIWFPKDYAGPFKESFRDYIAFAKRKHISIPPIFSSSCPWEKREDFLEYCNTESFKEHVQWFLDTMEIQTEFMTEHLFFTLDAILDKSDSYEEKIKILDTLQGLFKSAEGIFAVIDYLNFKGEGLSLTEIYQNKGWGLYHVLKRCDSPSVISFQEAAIQCLIERVQNAPIERHEERWLEGWKARISRYSSKLI